MSVVSFETLYFFLGSLINFAALNKKFQESSVPKKKKISTVISYLCTVQSVTCKRDDYEILSRKAIKCLLFTSVPWKNREERKYFYRIQNEEGIFFSAIFLCTAEPKKYFNIMNIKNILLIDLRPYEAGTNPFLQ